MGTIPTSQKVGASKFVIRVYLKKNHGRWGFPGNRKTTLDTPLHRAWYAFEAQAISFTHNLPQYTQLQMSTNIAGKVRVPAMDKRPVHDSQYNCTLIAFAKWNHG